MSDENRKADALYIPSALVKGADAFERLPAATAIARPLLALAGGEVPVISPHEPDRWGGFSYFVRRSHSDTKLFPKSHPRSGEVRHDWQDGPDGIKLGYSRGD